MHPPHLSQMKYEYDIQYCLAYFLMEKIQMVEIAHVTPIP